MKKGQTVRIKATGQIGTVIGVNDTAIHVQLDDAQKTIVKLTRDAVILITLIHDIVDAVKSLIKTIGSIFKKKNKDNEK